MALKILLADDSMTAQNMGKKILVEAGYEVIAVSNGAAAVKKIAEHKPDLVVADVYMPGYSGLEVCERVKNAQETAKTPVLLTVGKMEPFKPEDGQRVRSDGLIIKPFEASDLLAAVKKIEQKLAQAAAVPAETVKIAVPEEFKDESYEEWKVAAEEPVEAAPAAAKFEVPSDMASAPAFDMDGMMGEAPPPEPVAVAPSFQASSVAHVEVEPVAPEPIPIAPEPAAAPAEFREMTVAEELKRVRTERDPALEPTVLEEVPEAPELERDPELITDAVEMGQFVTKFGVEGPVEPVAVGLASDMPELYADHQQAAEALETQDVSAAAADVMARTGDTQEVSASAATVEEAAPADAEFETRVAAAMSAFEAPAEVAAQPQVETAPEIVAQPGMDMQAIEAFAKAVADIPAELAAPEPELLMTEPEPVAQAAPEPVVEAPTPSLEAEMAKAFATTESNVEPAPTAAMAAIVGGAPQAVEAGGLDDETLGHIVSSVVERLKPELIAEIRRKMAEKK